MASQYRRRSLMLNTIAKVAQGNPTIITDSSSRRLQKLNIYGQSEQDSTTGSQLLDSSLYKDSATGSGVTYTKQSDGSIKRTGTATDKTGNVWFGGSYVESKDDPKYKVLFTLQPGTYTAIDCVLFSLSVGYFGTFTIEEPLEISGLRNVVFEVGKRYNDIIYPMLNKGSTALPFEPYTGGKPSPSPDYPQEIISKEVNEIKVTNGADLSQTVTLSDPITLRGIPVSSGGNVTIDGQQYISDYIDPQKGKLIQLITSVVITSKNIDNRIENEKEKTNLYSLINLVVPPSNRKSLNSQEPIYCNILKRNPTQYEGNYTSEEECIGYTDASNFLRINLDKNGVGKSPETLKSYLDNMQESGNPVVVDYVSATPIETDLPQEAQEAIRALTTYYPNTVIQTGCWNEVTYSAKRGG